LQSRFTKLKNPALIAQLQGFIFARLIKYKEKKMQQEIIISGDVEEMNKKVNAFLDKLRTANCAFKAIHTTITRDDRYKSMGSMVFVYHSVILYDAFQRHSDMGGFVGAGPINWDMP
jgi:hypothetical protein